MTPWHTVPGTDQQQAGRVLRITEARWDGSVFPSAALGSPRAEILRHAFAYLQVAWRWIERKRTQQLSSRRLRVAETISLGEKRSVSIVIVDGAQFLIGCSAGSVQLLAELARKHDEEREA